MDMGFTTLWVKQTTKQRLLKHGHMKESEDTLLNRLLNIIEGKK